MRKINFDIHCVWSVALPSKPCFSIIFNFYTLKMFVANVETCKSSLTQSWKITLVQSLQCLPFLPLPQRLKYFFMKSNIFYFIFSVSYFSVFNRFFQSLIAGSITIKSFFCGIVSYCVCHCQSPPLQVLHLQARLGA